MEKRKIQYSDKKLSRKKSKAARRIKKTINAMVILTIAFFAVILYFRYGIDVIEMYKDSAYFVNNSSKDTFKSEQTSEIYDINNKLITTINGEKNVYYLKDEDIPQYFKDAMVAVEDRKFYAHNGVDLEGVGRAFVALIKHDGKVTQGGSTITQQLARNVFLSHNVSWQRKTEEVFIAVKLEKKYSKKEIMEFYLNNIYFANGYYGIGAASKGYFNKDVEELTLSEVAFLCAIPNNPTLYNPVTKYDNTIKRRDKILKDMLEEGFIKESIYELAVNENIKLDRQDKEVYNYVETYVYYCSTVALMEAQGFKFQYKFDTQEEKDAYEEQFREAYDKYQGSLFTGGYRIYTTIDMDKQDILQKSLDEELISDITTNDDGVYELQGAAVCIDNATGKVTAIVGGRSQSIPGYTLNRGYQSPRQPGSAIKPLIVYAPQLERGYTPETMVKDSYIEGGPSDGGNYEGSITLREAVVKSKNVVAYRLYTELTQSVGLEYLFQMKFAHLTMSDRDNPVACLGGFEYGTTAVEMASGYATICNDGVYRNPTCIRYINTAENDLVINKESEGKRIYDQNATRMMTDILTGVLKKGGTASGYGLENMSCAGKTGTTSENKDGWFCGYSPYYTTAVWVGYDMPKTLDGLRGNTFPVKIWNGYMNNIHKGLENKNFSEK